MRDVDSAEWVTIKKVCGVLEPIREVTTRIQGGRAGLLSHAFFLCHDLAQILMNGQMEIIDWKRRWVTETPSRDGAEEVRNAHDLTSDARQVREVAVQKLGQRKVGVPELDVETMTLFLDPRHLRLEETVCDNEDTSELLERARSATLDTASGMTIAPDERPGKGKTLSTSG